MEHFQPLKINNNLWLVYLECNPKKDSYGWFIYKLKCLKSEEKTYLEAKK